MTGGDSGRRALTPFEQADRWTKWWSRLSQVAGLALAGYEVVLRHAGAQNGVLIFCAAMMLGPLGLRMLVRGVGEWAQQTDQDLQKEEHRDP